MPPWPRPLRRAHRSAGRAPSRPGDYIVLRAWIDVIVAISACPQEFNPITGWYPTELEVEIMEPAETVA